MGDKVKKAEAKHKRLSKSERKHIRRAKQEARQGVTPAAPPAR